MSPASVPLLIYLVTLTFTPLQWTQWALNKWTLPNWESRFLLQLTQIRQEITMSPDQQTALNIAQRELASITREAQVSQIKELIREDLRTIFWHKQFQKDSIMAHSKLFALELVQQSLDEFARKNNLMSPHLSDGEKARVLRLFIEQYVQEKFCPYPGNIPPSPPSDRWIEYMIICKS